MKFTWAVIGLACIAVAGCNKPSSADSGASAPDSSAPAVDSNAPVAASPATSDNSPPSSMPSGNPAAVEATQGVQLTAQDFAQNAAASDMFEIASSKVALQRSHNPRIKAFATMMVADHTKTTAALKAAVAKSGQDLMPASMPDDKQAQLQDLQTVAAANFDKKYMDDQVNGHQAALDLMSRYANDGRVPALQDVAKKTGPLVQTHLDKAKALRQQLG